MLALLEFFWGTPASTVGNYYYDFDAAINGIGTVASPFNTWSGTTVVAGATYYFKRGTTCDVTNFTLTVSGSAGLPVTYTAYYNADGSDDTSKPRPILANTVALTSLAVTRTYNIIEHWDIRTTTLTTASSDKASIFLGSNCTISDCIITSNVGCIASYDKSNITIINNTLHGASCVTTVANNILIISDTTVTSNATVQGNTILHYGGGNTNSHCAKIQTTGAAGLVNLSVTGNTIRPAVNFQRPLPGRGFINETETMDQPTHIVGCVNKPERIYCRNKGGFGMRFVRAAGATITGNNIRGFQDAIFFVGGSSIAVGATISNNILNYNMHFGIHCTTDAVGCTIEYNDCSYNGCDVNDGVSLFAYGRGIELSSAAGQGRCGGHTIRYNTCTYNFNFGGPNDNASEGVGIGLDDGTNNCLVAGNYIAFNEGNGVQYYGGTLGSGTPAISATNNNVVANLFVSNGTYAVKNRRTGGTYDTLFSTHINCASTQGGISYIANNVFTGTTPCGVSQDYLCLSIVIANNIFNATPHAIRFSTLQLPLGYGTFNNDFFNVTQKYSSNAVNGNGAPTYPNIAYTGTNDFTFDPLMDASYRPSHVSPALDVGLHVGTFSDYEGTPFLNPPDIGMYEVLFVEPPIPPVPTPTTAPFPSGSGSGKEQCYEMLPDSYWEDREARLLEAVKKEAPAPERVRIIDTAIAAAIDRCTQEHDYLMQNLMKLDSVEELKSVAKHIKDLNTQISSLKSRLYKWIAVEENE